MNKIINKSINSPIQIAIISILLTILIAFGVRWFIIDDDFFKMFPKDLESRLLWEDMTREFGDSEFLFIAFGQDDRDIYNIETINIIKELTEELSEIPIVDKVISLSTIDKIESDPEDETWLLVDKLFPDKALDINQIINAKKYLNNNPDVKNRLVSNDEVYTAIAVRSLIVNEDGSYRNNSDLMNEILPITDRYLSKYNVHYAGNPYITGEVPNLIRSDVSKLMLSGILIMIFLLYINIRNFKAVSMILCLIILSIVCMNGFMGWMFYLTGKEIFNFTIINTSMPIVLLTIANSDGVHIITHFFKELRITKNKKKAIENSMDALKMPIFLTSITTIIAFLAMIFAPIPQMFGYGICISFGIFWAWFLSNTLLPSMIMLFNWDLNSISILKQGFLEKSIKRIGDLIFTNPKKILIMGVSLVLVGIIGIGFLKVEVNIIKFFKDGNSIRESTEFVDDNFSGTMSLLMRVNADMKNPETLREISKIQEYIETHPEVGMTLSLSDIIKQMHETLYNDEEYYSIPDSLNQVSNLLFMAPGDQLDMVVNTTTYKKGMIHSYLSSISTDEIVTISDDINNFIDTEIEDDLNIETSGLMILLKDFISLVINSSVISILVSIIAIFIISLIFFKQPWWALMSIIPLCSAVILNFGLMGIFGIKLSHLTALLTSIIIGVGVDFAVHYISSFRWKLRLGVENSKLSKLTMDDVGYPILLDVVSNMGFAALLFSDLIPLNYMGGLMVFAMLTTSFGTFLLMGTTIEILRKKINFR